MDKLDIGHHISQRYNQELEEIRNKVLAMGGLVEQQLGNALQAYSKRDGEMAEQVITDDYQVNSLEVSIDEECTQVLARRQPAAGDLRLIVSVIKTITDLERVGDEVCKVAKMTTALVDLDIPSDNGIDIEHLGNHVRQMLHDALDAFARTDVDAALKVAQEDAKVDREYELLMRQLVDQMMDDPRAIRRSLDLMWTIRALERIGDHSRNICEYVIYLVKGRDVRHVSLEQMEEEASKH